MFALSEFVDPGDGADQEGPIDQCHEEDEDAATEGGESLSLDACPEKVLDGLPVLQRAVLVPYFAPSETQDCGAHE